MTVITMTDMNSRTRFIRKSELEAVIDFKLDLVDLLFIDAMYTYKDCENDINHCLKIVKPGVLSGHDYQLRVCGVIMAFNKILGMDNVEIGQDSTWFNNKSWANFN
jgi:hypothetical protein